MNTVIALAGVVIKELYRRKDFYVLFILTAVITLVLGSVNFFGEDNIARGHAEILKGWLDNPDPPGSWDAHYEPFAVDGNRAVATGTSHYLPGHPSGDRVYHNVYLLDFAPDGRCSEFTELYMREQNPTPEPA